MKTGPEEMRIAQHPGCNPECQSCHYKHLTYSEQLDRKQAWAEKQLKAWNSVLHKIKPAPVGERIGYRSKSWLRSYFDPQSHEVSFGFYKSVYVESEWTKTLVSWNTCPLHSLAVQEIIQTLRKFLAQEAVREILEDALMGVWLGPPHLVLVCRRPILASLQSLSIDWSALAIGPFQHVAFHFNPQVGRRVFGTQPIQTVFKNPASPLADSPLVGFQQVSQTLLREARGVAVQALTHSQPSTVLDLYCGTGELAHLLPPQIDWVGIELSSEAASFADASRLPGRKLHAAFVGSVEDRLRDPKVRQLVESASYTLYVNPPRSGLSDAARTQILELTAKNSPRHLVYLSCSASSLARDLVAFEKAGYQITSLQPYDFFPQTEHFETLALLQLT